jgi:signal transduction histidine kinase
MFLKKIPNFYSHLSLRLKLTFIFVSIFGAMTLIFDGLNFRVMMQALDDENDINLYNLAVEFYNAEENNFLGDVSLFPENLEKKKIFAFNVGSVLVQIRHISGKILYRQGEFGAYDLPVRNEFSQLNKDDDVVYRTLRDTSQIPTPEAETYRMLSIQWKTPDTILQIAVPRTHIEAVIRQRNQVLIIGIPIVLIIAALGGSFLAGRAIKPVQGVIAIAREIDGSELSQRVPLPKSEDEIKELAQTFNEMLNRIERAFKSQERFVADASHQLLTPLTIMKTELEMSLRRKNESEEKQITQKAFQKDLLRSQLQEVDHLIRIVQDMLLLARIDAGRGSLKLQDHYLDELVLEAFEHIEKLAQKKSINLKFDILGLETHRPQIRVDHDLLIHLVVNLLENAIKYSDPGQTISVLLQSEKQLLRLVIKDQGPGIPPAQFETIFQRFSRDPMISAKVKGYGLGLAIAKKIANLHGAKLEPAHVVGRGAEFHFEIKII